MLWSIMRGAVAGFCGDPFGCWELPLLPPLMLCQYSVRCLLYIPYCSINRTGKKTFSILNTTVYMHSGILYLSPVPEHSSTGLGSLLPVSDRFRYWHFCSFWYRSAFKKGIHPARLYCWRCKERHPARPYFWLWKVITLHVHYAGCGNGYTVHRYYL
jgi:hypothetical protein